MGYSCSAKASLTMDAMLAILTTAGPVFTPNSSLSMSNTWKVDETEYFFERGRENEDGAITGSLYRNAPDGKTCRKMGSVRVSPDGTIARFPTATKEQRIKATAKGLLDYAARHGATVHSTNRYANV